MRGHVCLTNRSEFQPLFRRKPRKKQIPPLPLRRASLAQGPVGMTRSAWRTIDSGLILVGVVTFFDEGGGADDVVGGGFAAGWFQGDAHGQAVPLGGLADGDEVVALRP